MHDKLEKIKNESLRDGNDVIVHFDNFEWLIKTIEQQKTRLDHREKGLQERDKEIESWRDIVDSGECNN